MSQEFVSQREFARRIGRSNVWVSRLVKEGKLPTNNKGRIPFDDGLKAYESSQRVGYDANREHGEKQRRASKAPAKKTERKTAAAKEVETLPEDDAPALLQTNVTESRVNAAYNKARLAEKTYQAKLKELEYKEAQGLLVPIEDIKADAAQLGSEIRERLGSIGARIAAVCEGKKAREIEGIISDAINEVLEALHKSRFKD